MPGRKRKARRLIRPVTPDLPEPTPQPEPEPTGTPEGTRLFNWLMADLKDELERATLEDFEGGTRH